MKKLLIILLSTGMITACQQGPNTSQQTQEFINGYVDKFQELYIASSHAEWESNTKIIEGDTVIAAATRKANEAFASFTGSAANITKATELLKKKEEITPLQLKQLKTILYMAANNPETVSGLVKERIKAETAQTEKLYGYDFQLDSQSVTTNAIDQILNEETDEEKRLLAWEASKEVGKGLKEGLSNLQRLRNKTVQALGYDDFFTYQASDYEMSREEMMKLMHNSVKEVWPLYRELHTYARYELAKKYGAEEVPALLPAHWLPNRWGQDWSSLVTVEGLDLDSIIGSKSPEWIVEQGERFYVSLGFPELPESFWEKSDLYPLPEDAKYKKNNHASAWHLDLNIDVRSLMSVTPTPEWYETSHHELLHDLYQSGCSLINERRCQQGIPRSLR